MENKLGILEKGRGGMTLLVVLAHINLLVDCNLFHGLFIQGWCGVDFFFVLSGFLMIWTYNERTSPIAYVKKRFIRIYPVYWMYTLVTLIMNLFIVLIFDSSLISWINLDLSGLIRSFLCLPTNVAINEMPIIPPAWTLSYEIFFYIISLFLYIYGRRIFRGILIVWGGLIITRTGFIISNPYIDFILDPLFLEFLGGMLIAQIIKYKKSKKIENVISLGVGIVWLVVFWSMENMEIDILTHFNRVFKFGVAFAFIVYGAVGLEISGMFKNRKNFGSSILEFLERISFSLYLVHYPLVAMLSIMCRKLHISAIVAFVAISFICILAGGISHYLIEKNIIYVCNKKFIENVKSY